MIYCPHCRRPSARATGACPHCGKPLGGGAAPPPPKPAAGAGAPGQRIGGVEFDLDDDGSGESLELAGDDYVAPQTAAVQGIPGLGGGADLGPAPAEESEPALSLAEVDEPPPRTSAKPLVKARDVDDDEVRAAAGFGSPQPGPLGAIRYGLKVNARLKELAVELDRAAEREHTAIERLRAARADLGRKAGRAKLAGDDLEALVTRAARADAERDGAETRRAGIESQQKGGLGEVERAIAGLEAEALPFRQEEAEAARRLEALRTDRKRSEAKIKRSEIERRNLTELIEKRQQAYADLQKPKPERQQLLADITKFEADLAPINERIDQARGELETFDKPLADAEAALTAVRGRVSEKLTQISALRDEADKLRREFTAAVGSAAASVQEESRRADEAWAVVGERVFGGLARGGPLAEERENVAAALERCDDTKRQVDLLTRARDSYDRQTVKQAKQYAVFGGVILLALVVLVIVLIVS